jgi:DNA ligase-associated metallophosphoesterase
MLKEVDLLGERWMLHAHRALFWPARSCLVVSDLHLGKAAHLRKGGLAIPEGHDDQTLKRLTALLDLFKPQRLLVLGDLFHSSHNHAWPGFVTWAQAQHCAVELVPGNHDVLDPSRYLDAGIIVHDEVLELTPFVLTHDGGSSTRNGTISGHVHPGIILSGQGRQRIRVPAFLISEQRLLLPAFGTSTGLHPVDPQPNDRVFACTGKEVMEVTGLFAARATAGH